MSPDASLTRPPGTAARSRWLAICVVVAVGVLVLDQATKAFVRARLEPGETWPVGWELIRIAHVRNTGAAFGILPDATTVLTIATIVAAIAIAALIYTFVTHHRWYAICLALILGGAVGNLVDRLRFGAVTDFIDPIAYPAFNVADSSIVIGVAVLLVLTLFAGDRERHEPAREDGEHAAVADPREAPSREAPR